MPSHKHILFLYKKTAQCSDKEISAATKQLKEYTLHLRAVAKRADYTAVESSINAPSDTAALSTIKKIAQEKKTKHLKYVIVVGIGGSQLGTKAIYEALYGVSGSLRGAHPVILFLDTTDPRLFEEVSGLFGTHIKTLEQFLIVVVTKSGTTTETIADFEALAAVATQKVGDIKNRVVMVTDSDTTLWYSALERKYATLEIQKTVGGRFSVFTAVGLFPLLMAGVNVDELLRGARDMRDTCLREGAENAARVSAALLYLHYQKGIRMHNTFLFNPSLESFGKWYRQLLGESIGKEHDRKGTVVHTGITPTVSIGSTDLHSMAQLYFAGPRDAFTTFIYAPDGRSAARVPKKLMFPVVEGIAGKRLSEIMEAILEGVKQAYSKNKIAFADMWLPALDEYSLGQLMQFKMMEIMYVAELLNVNAFDQPSVEEYKQETRRILQGK